MKFGSKTIINGNIPKPTLEDEICLLQAANEINDLMPKFIRQQTWTLENGKTYPMMVMEIPVFKKYYLGELSSK